LGALQKRGVYAKPRVDGEQDKNSPTGFNKVAVSTQVSFHGKKLEAVKVMKQSEKIDDQFAIKASNLQSIKLDEVLSYELDIKGLTL